MESQDIYLNNVNYIDLLKKKNMIGVIEFDGKEPIYSLLVSLSVALLECLGYENQSITESEFKKYLKLNNIWIFNNIDDFIRAKKDWAKSDRPKPKRPFSQKQREELSERMRKINLDRKKARSDNITDKTSV